MIFRLSCTPFSSGSICRRWPYVVSVPAPEPEHSAEEDSILAVDMAVEGDRRQAALVEGVEPDQALGDTHILHAGDPVNVSRMSAFGSEMTENARDSCEGADKHHVGLAIHVEEDTSALPWDPGTVHDGWGLAEGGKGSGRPALEVVEETVSHSSHRLGSGRPEGGIEDVEVP